jgi:hypothetical protein
MPEPTQRTALGAHIEDGRHEVTAYDVYVLESRIESEGLSINPRRIIEDPVLGDTFYFHEVVYRLEDKSGGESRDFESLQDLAVEVLEEGCIEEGVHYKNKENVMILDPDDDGNNVYLDRNLNEREVRKLDFFLTFQ